MNAELLKNWLTTLFGIMAGLPTIVLGVFTPGTPMALSPQYTHILMIVGGVGLVGLGVVSKAINVHSTAAQVAESTTDKAQDSATTSTQSVQPLPQGGVAVTSQSTTVTKPEVKP